MSRVLGIVYGFDDMQTKKRSRISRSISIATAPRYARLHTSPTLPEPYLIPGLPTPIFSIPEPAETVDSAAVSEYREEA